MEEVGRLLGSYAPSGNEAQTKEDLVRPILRLLGHVFEVQLALAPPILLLPAVLFVIQREAIGREERYLERTFGEEYLDCKASVRRWV